MFYAAAFRLKSRSNVGNMMFEIVRFLVVRSASPLSEQLRHEPHVPPQPHVSDLFRIYFEVAVKPNEGIGEAIRLGIRRTEVWIVF